MGTTDLPNPLCDNFDKYQTQEYIEKSKDLGN